MSKIETNLKSNKVLNHIRAMYRKWNISYPLNPELDWFEIQNDEKLKSAAAKDLFDAIVGGELQPDVLIALFPRSIRRIDEMNENPRNT